MRTKILQEFAGRIELTKFNNFCECSRERLISGSNFLINFFLEMN